MIIPRKVYQVVFGEVDKNGDLGSNVYMVVARTVEHAIEIARKLHGSKEDYIREVELFVKKLDAD